MGKIISGLKWTVVEKFSVQIVQFVLSIIIARLVSPTEYGILAILMVFINIPQVFIDSGLGNALIYRNKMDEDSMQTTFSFNLAVSSAFVVLMFFAAPFIESFYNLPKLSLYIRTTSIVLLTNSLIVVPTAILKIKLDFKPLSVANVCSTILSGIIGVAMAYGGFGIWALIGQLMSRSIILAFMLVFNCKWMPKLHFKKQAFLPLYRYGINIFCVGMITKFTDEGISFLIAKKLSPWNLGIYTRSLQFASFSQASFSAVIQTVMFPSFSAIKDNKEKFHQVFRDAIEYQAAFSMPLWFALALLAKPIVLLLLTEKWIAVVPLLQIICMGKLLVLVGNITEQILMAKGRSDLFLRQQIFKMGLKLVAVLGALPFGLIAITVADAATTFCNFFITNAFAHNVDEIGIFKQLRIVLPYFVSSVVAAIIGSASIWMIDNNLLEIVVFAIVFLFVYYIMVEKVYKKTLLTTLYLKVF